MQSDKLPKMPVTAFSRRDVVQDGVEVNPMFTYRQMQEYALAARMMALGEVFLEAHRRFLANYKQGDPYQQGCCHEMMFFELWLKDLMEQDA